MVINIKSTERESGDGFRTLGSTMLASSIRWDVLSYGRRRYGVV